MAVSTGKTRVSVTIDRTTHSALSEIGRLKDRPISYVMQQAVSFYLTKHPDAHLTSIMGKQKIFEALDDC